MSPNVHRPGCRPSYYEAQKQAGVTAAERKARKLWFNGSVFVDEALQDLRRRSSAAWAKNALASSITRWLRAFLVHGLQFRHPLSDIARHALSIARLCWEALKRIASQKDIASLEADFTLLFEVEQPRSLMGSGA